jgi:3-methylfumaryl-CoA hydratase
MTTDYLNAADMKDWLGRTATANDVITAFPLNALSATLDRDDPAASAGSAVPPLWHWMYFLPIFRSADTRADGHGRGGEFMPPIDLPRRVWAGSRFVWNRENPLRVGDSARRVSRIGSITPKRGKSGDMVFVKVVHEFHNEKGLCITNEHNAAFLGPAEPGKAPSPGVLAETDAKWQRDITPDAVFLFRYSALTFNSHRIHFDWPYATQKEGYPTLLVHGPVQAILLADLIRRNVPGAVIESLEFKALRPAFVDRPLSLCGNRDGNTVELWASNEEGIVTMSATAQIR